jgi:beta-lactamase class A
MIALSLVACGGDAETPERPGGSGASAAEEEAAQREAEAQRLADLLEKQQGNVPADDSVPEPATGNILSESARADFKSLAASLPGDVGLAVAPVGGAGAAEQLGSLTGGVAWSTSKVPIAMAAIEADVAGENDLSAAISASDNDAAQRLWDALGGGGTAASAADEQLRAAGDQSTSTQSSTLRDGFTAFGQTDWTLSDQAQFMSGMGCTDNGSQVLNLMAQTVSAQRWGIGTVDATAPLKGGWGPGSQPGAAGGYLDRQMGIVSIDGAPVAVAIATAPADGSHETGTTNLSKIAEWLASNAEVTGLPTGCTR